MTFILKILILISAIQVALLAGAWSRLLPWQGFLLFLVMLGLGTAVALYLLKRYRGNVPFERSLCLFVTIETVLTALLLCASYKEIVYDYQPLLAQRAFAVLAVLAVLHKIFVKPAREFCQASWEFIARPRNRPALRILVDAGMVVFLALFIYVPDVDGVLARMFVGEQFHHWDYVIPAAWNYLKGGLPYVDVISQYGVGIPVVIAWWSKLSGGFSYEHTFMFFMTVCIIYYVMIYVFLRCWLKSVPVVLVAILMGIKIQMFHSGVSPFVFTYPSSIVARNFFDVFFFLAVWKHLETAKPIWLVASACICALAVFNLTDTGVYLIAAFYMYLILRVISPSPVITWGWAVGYAVAVPLLVLVLFWGAVGGHVFTRLFWSNMAEYIIYFLSGHGMIPMSESLHYNYFCASAMGFAVPLLYCASLLVIGTLCFLRKIHARHVLVMVLCVYGLGLYHYYVARSAVTSYYVSGLPFVFVACFWLKKGMEKLEDGSRLKWSVVAVLLAVFSLATNHLALAYPNIFNFSRNPMTDPLVTVAFPDQRGYLNHKVLPYGEDYRLPINSLGDTDEKLLTQRDFASDGELKAFYAREFDFSEDAHLIARLTAPHQAVALLSSFELKILIQADRRAFFYFTPLLTSRPMRMRTYPLEAVHSAAYLKKTLAQLAQGQPEYIFMERIFLDQRIPLAYTSDMPRLLAILDYIRAYYAPTAYGKYLVAMRRK